jgi:L-ascorbate metabolism protein UlaG (beta-lactamase superfamily)
MELTKFGHSCVRISEGGATLVIDPGAWSEHEAIVGADGILITHEHPDHWQLAQLRATSSPIFTIQAVADAITSADPSLAEQVTVVAPEQTFEAAGIPVRAVGNWHAVIHPEYPTIHNSGYVVGSARTVYHPGDALTGPGQPVNLLLAPVSAPWLRVREAINFVRDVGAAQNLAIHEGVYSERGLGIVDLHMGNLVPPSQTYQRFKAAETLQV